MPEEDTQEIPPKPPKRTRTGEIIGAATEGVQVVSRLSPQQAIVVICVVLMGFVCVSQAFNTWSDREERKAASSERIEAAASTIRENNAQAELTRQHCAQESSSLRGFFADQNERRMRFEADEKAKDRAVLTSLTAAFEELKKVLSKKPGEIEEDP